MKKTAVLVNMARGGIVDEPALIAALRDGTIAGAALDVLRGRAAAGRQPAADAAERRFSRRT